jgi:uncharacterized membrane protein
MPAHLFIVHFPVVLLVVGAAADVLGVLTRNAALRAGAGWLIILGALAALLAFMTGGAALSYLLLSQPPGAEAVALHAQWGSAGLWPITVTGALRALWRRRLHGAPGWVNLAMAVVSAVVVVGATVTGTAIRHG